MRPSRAVTNRKTGYLSEMIWPTPNASIDTGKPLPQRKPNPSGGQKPPLVNKIGGQLNPDWVEWLMGWPIGWSSLEPITELIWLDWSVDPADVESIKQWATPNASARLGRNPNTGSGEGLYYQAREAERMWPTPRCNKTTDEKYETWKKRQEKGGVSTPPLTLAVKMKKWPTPIQGDAHLSSNPEVAQRRIDEGKITLSRDVQCDSQPHGIIPRVAIGIKDRVNRLKAIGNGQVSQCAATAWRILKP